MRHPSEFWADRRQRGHYTGFGVTSGWAVTRPKAWETRFLGQPRSMSASGEKGNNVVIAQNAVLWEPSRMRLLLRMSQRLDATLCS